MNGTILITGAGRGIGLELARQYAEAGWRVLAGCRDPEQAETLRAVAARYSRRLSVHPLEVTDDTQIAALAQLLRDTPIDILFNNAGVYGRDDDRFGNVDEASWLHTLRVNTIAPMKMMEAFVEHVAASRRKVMASMSSRMGSMADNSSGGSYVYRSSKAALNAVVKSASIDLRPRGITTVVLHPGWVKTDMGGPDAQITPQESVTHLRAILDNISLAHSGTFFDIGGTVLPW